MLLDIKTEKDIYFSKIKNIWLDSKSSFPDFLLEITNESKERNEIYIDSIFNDFQNQLKKFSRFPIHQKKWKQKTNKMLMDVLCKETIINVHLSMDRATIDLFQDEIKDFLRHVRKFSPELSFCDMGQALRNYIVYALFKELKQDDSGFYLPCFGYSMLYPYTDNYIDNEEYSDQEKSEYNHLIRDKINGKQVKANSRHQIKTCELLQAIENEYPREEDPSVYTLLMLMLEAQEDSLRQQKKELPLTTEEILDISICKGGLSVIIDRFFVKKEITKDDFFFYLAFGFFLQLVDDLQDMKEDSEKGNHTIFTFDLHFKQGEMIVNKLLHFIHETMSNYECENELFKDFILSNCYQIIYSSIEGSKEFFSKEYLSKLENFLPVRFSFWGRFKNNQFGNSDIKANKKYMKILDYLII